jgi:hypothetical protein
MYTKNVRKLAQRVAKKGYRLEKKAMTYRDLAGGIVGFPTRGQLDSSRIRPGDISVTLHQREPNALQNLGALTDAERRSPKAVMHALGKGLIDEGGSHARLILDPTDQWSNAAGMPFADENIYRSFSPSVVVRPANTTAAQGQAAAERVQRQLDLATQLSVGGRWADLNTGEKIRYEYPKYIKDKGRNPAALQRLAERFNEEEVSRLGPLVQGVAGPHVERLARRIAMAGRSPVCDPTAQVCSTSMIHAWRAPGALGDRAAQHILNMPELTLAQAEQFATPGRLVHSKGTELVTADFDIDEALRELQQSKARPSLREVAAAIPVREIMNERLTPKEILEQVNKRLPSRVAPFVTRATNAMSSLRSRLGR